MTPAGRTALRTIQTAQAAWADALGAKIGEQELRQASILLDRVLQTLGPHAPDAPPTDSA
jgi:DNA-binding MarR family transcriptional regulator